MTPNSSPKPAAVSDAEQDAELRRQPPDLDRVRRDIGRRAEERGVAERQQPDIADQQVEGAGEQREAQRLGQEHG